MTTLQSAPRATTTGPSPARGRGRRSTRWLPTVVLLLGAAYCLVPVLWVLTAATKSPGELFTTVPFRPGTGFLDNLRGLFSYGGGEFGRWALNSALYAGAGSLLSTAMSAAAGYGLAKFAFRGRRVLLVALFGGVLMPGITLAVPQYLLLSAVGLAGTYWSVLLPLLVNPFGIYLCWVFASSSVPDETLEAARLDGAGELRTFWAISVPMMLPGLVTVLLLQFIGIWNNFLLPFIMLSDQGRYPLTLGLYTLLARGSGESALYSLAVTGAAVSVVPLVALMLVLQRFWRVDLLSGGVKG
ncbi:carbohydrate ABC transporter permease [Pseudokineococcus marinus]|uniref:Carbohydrate ABC transporter permease n=1 Tax=Pseudokineococcus marinus TaxID=351215 RepID=A0A849BPP5_9ACTN|nr:carbohydrate ABC transporter permease [Pseudokineococcus marinus]NNH21526.1 carbohydrate ABC transporter permease [Pseudokineococcus marinus]